MKFKVVEVYKDNLGNQIACTVMTETKTKIKESIAGIRIYFDTGHCINAYLTKNGTVHGKKGYRLSYITIKSATTYQNGFEVFSGHNLETLIANSGVMNKNSRDFVSGIIEYCKNQNLQGVLSISGLRGVGKTVGILQSILHLLKTGVSPADCTYITVSQVKKTTCKMLRCLLDTIQSKYIFIDEVTNISGLITDSAFLYDKYIMEGRRIVLSGTNSLVLVESKTSALYHRTILMNVSFINYNEAKRTLKCNLNEYVCMGGLYKADVFSEVEGMYNYVETAVVQNIVGTLSRNTAGTGLFDLKGIAEGKIRAIVFLSLYSVVFSSLNLNKDIAVTRLVNLFDISGTSLYTTDTLNEMVRREFGLVLQSKVTEQELTHILNAMKEIGVLIEVRNIACSRESKKYYITNQCIVNVLIKDILTYLQRETGLSFKSKQKGMRGFRGLLFESLIMTHTVKYFERYSDYTVGYYRDDRNREIDMVVQYTPEVGLLDDESDYLLMEIKMTADKDTAIVKSEWINDAEVHNQIEEGRVLKNYILYSGASGVFDGFDKRDEMSARYNEEKMDKISEKNYKVPLINVEYYLSNTTEFYRSVGFE